MLLAVAPSSPIFCFIAMASAVFAALLVFATIAVSIAERPRHGTAMDDPAEREWWWRIR